LRIQSQDCNHSQSYEASSAIWDQTVLLPPDTDEHASIQIDTQFSYPAGLKNELIFVFVIYIDDLPVHRQSPIQVLTTR